MPTANYTTAKDARAVPKPLWLLRPLGIPFKLTGSGNARLSLASAVPSFASPAASYKAFAVEFPQELSEEIDLLAGSTRVGQLIVRFLDSDAYVTGLLYPMPSLPATRLTAGVGASTILWQVSTTTGISVDDIMFIGAETVRVTSVIPPTQIEVARGQYGSRAVPHGASTSSKLRDDGLYKRPPFWRGRESVFAFNHDETGHTESDEQVLFAGLLDRVLLSDAGTSWAFSLRSAIADARRPVGWGQYTGTIEQVTWLPERPIRSGLMAVRRTNEAGRFWNDAASDKGFLRLDDEILQVKFLGTHNGLDEFAVESAGQLGTKNDSHEIGEFGKGLVHEVLSTEDDAERTPVQQFVVAGTARSDPFSILLALLTSTGRADNGTYDVLPEQWGLGIPQARIDVSRFEALRDSHQRFAGMRFPDHLLGWEPGPFSVKELAEKNWLGPLGLYLKTDDQGRISIDVYEDTYTAQTTAADFTERDIINRVPLDYDTGEGKVLTRVEMRFSGRRREPVRITALNVVQRERYPDDGNDGVLVYDVPGLRAGTGAERTLRDRAIAIVSARAYPSPIVVVEVGWNWHLLEVGDVVTLDDSTLPNHVTGGVGVTATTGRWRITSKSIDFEGVRVRLRLEATAPTRRVIAPAASITAWDGVGFVVTCAANDFTPTSNPAHAWQPLKDVSGFQVGQRITFIKKDLSLPGTTAVPTVSSINAGANTITLSGGFGAVSPGAGDILVFADYDASATASMKDHVAIGDDADSLIGATSDAAHRYAA